MVRTRRVFAETVTYIIVTVLEKAVSHWPFSDQFQQLADQNLLRFAKHGNSNF